MVAPMSPKSRLRTCARCRYWEPPVPDSSGVAPENGKCWLPLGDEKVATESLPTRANYGCLWWEKKGTS